MEQSKDYYLRKAREWAALDDSNISIDPGSDVEVDYDNDGVWVRAWVFIEHPEDDE